MTCLPRGIIRRIWLISDHMQHLISKFSPLSTFNLRYRPVYILSWYFFCPLQHADWVWHYHFRRSTVLDHLNSFGAIETSHWLLAYAGSRLLWCRKSLVLNWLRQILMIYHILVAWCFAERILILRLHRVYMWLRAVNLRFSCKLSLLSSWNLSSSSLI